MRVVITGPTGTIGLALINICMKKQIEVLAICRKGSSGISKIPKNPLLKVLEINLEEYSSVKIEGEYDTFYHFAWSDTFGDGRNNVYIQNDNIKYTLDAVKMAGKLGCKTFIGAGSQAEFGKLDGMIHAQTPTLPNTGYGIAKLCAGQLSRIQCKQMGIKHIWTRILSVYGPFDDERTMIASTLYGLIHGQKLSFTAAEQTWDFLYSKDAANILYLLAKKGKSEKVYCLGSGKAKKLKAFIEEMRDIANTEYPLIFGELPYASNQVMNLSVDVSELEKDLGELTWTSFREGIKETLEIMTENQDSKGDTKHEKR